MVTPDQKRARFEAQTSIPQVRVNDLVHDSCPGESNPMPTNWGRERQYQNTNEAQKSFSESRRMVTGPSLVSSRDIIVWKIPVCTCTPRSRSVAQYFS